MGRQVSKLLGSAAAVAALVATVDATAETPNLYGMPGHLEMPSAQVFPDAEIVASFSGFPGQERVTLTFQASERLTLAFRYGRVADYIQPGGEDLWDRSFDVAYQLLSEGRARPAVSIGMRDIIGTGVYSGEYIVASKSFGPGLTVSGGLGWGRLGTRGAIGSPFGERPPADVGEGGRLAAQQWFKGPAAPFAGINWDIDERWSVSAEYSSDALEAETALGLADPSSPVNLGLSYRTKDGHRLSLSWLHGETIGFGAHFALNPKRSAAPNGTEAGPVPVAPRNRAELNDLTWVAPGIDAEAAKLVAKPLAENGILLRNLSLEPRRVTVAIENRRYAAHPQAIGRTVRLLSRVMPTSVSEFRVVLIGEDDVPLSTTTLQRDDVERLEFAPAQAMLARTEIGAAPFPLRLPAQSEPLRWSIKPYVDLSYFDPDSPISVTGGLRLSGRYDLPGGLIAEGAIVARALTGQGDDGSTYTSSLPQVRTDGAAYNQSRIALQDATLTHLGRMSPDLYTRATVGYLEKAYAGAAGEVLWKPVDSRLGVGLELAYAKKRDYDGGLGFQDYDTVTGFASAYYEFDNGLIAQLDVGKYLAGDLGATVSLSREFDNGWQVGAWVTRTDASFADFGEGSFDKGITMTFPIEWASGTPSRNRSSLTLRSLSRDGGSRVSTGTGLYDRVREGHEAELADRWGRFWR